LTGRDPSTVFESGGLIDELNKRLAERMLDTELDHHLGSTAERRKPAITATGTGKTVVTDTRKLELSLLCDRHGRSTRY
jgi:transposase-like protein